MAHVVSEFTSLITRTAHLQIDVAHLTSEESVGLMSWTAQALLHAATTWEPPDLADQ